MAAFLKKLKTLFLNILGDIKLYPFPFFMVYDPSTFLVKGYHTRQAINAIQTGCIVMRGYKCYADGTSRTLEFTSATGR